MFGRLEQMPTNSLYLNLMLTGIIAQLAAMSLPLLRGLLLDTRIVFQPGVPSLYKVSFRIFELRVISVIQIIINNQINNNKI